MNPHGGGRLFSLLHAILFQWSNRTPLYLKERYENFQFEISGEHLGASSEGAEQPTGLKNYTKSSQSGLQFKMCGSQTLCILHFYTHATFFQLKLTPWTSVIRMVNI